MTDQADKTQQNYTAWAIVGLLAIGGALGWFYYDLRGSHELLVADLQSTEAELATSQSNVSRLESEVEVAQSNAKQLQQQLNEASRQKAELLTQAQRLKENEQALRAQLSSARSEIDSSQELQAEINNLYAQLDAQYAVSDELQALFIQSQSDNALLGEQIAVLNSENSELQAENALLGQQITQLNSENSELQQELSSKTVALSEAQTAEQLYQQAREQLALEQSENETYSETIARLRNEMDAEAQAMENLEDRLQSQLATLSAEKQQLVSQLEDGTTVIKLPESILFPTASAELNEDGLRTLSVLAEAMQSFPTHLISVQGHTDSRKIIPSSRNIYPTNWELSSARASSAVRALIDQGISDEQLQAVGFADTRPIVEEVDAATRAQNRRIEVLLYPNQFQTRVLDQP